MFISSFCSKLLSPSFLPFTVGFLCIFLYSLCIAFTFFSILWPYSTISVSILITGVLNSASDRLAISSSFSYILGVFICSHLGHISLYRRTCYIVRGGALGIHQGGATHGTAFGTVCWGGVRGGTVPFAWLLPCFQSLTLLPTSKLDSSGADSQVGGFVCILGPYGSLQQTLLWGWEFLLPPHPHRFLLPVVLRLYFSALEPSVAWSISLPVYPYAHMGPPATTLPPPLHPGCTSPPLLPVWMNVSSLSPWFLDFHTVQFSGSTGCFLFFNLLLSFFWLCKEAEFIYLHLHLGPWFS